MLEEFAARQGFTNIVHAEERQARQLIMHRNQERYRNSLSKQKRNAVPKVYGWCDILM